LPFVSTAAMNSAGKVSFQPGGLIRFDTVSGAVRFAEGGSRQSR